MTTMTYVTALGINWTNCKVSCAGDGSVYADLVWVSGDAIPSQADLDSWIATAPTPGQIISIYAFRKRFTLTEKVMLEFAGQDDPTQTMTVRQMSAALRVYMADLDLANYVDLNDPETIEGIGSLVAAGLLSSERASEILNTPPTANEVP